MISRTFAIRFLCACLGASLVAGTRATETPPGAMSPLDVLNLPGLSDPVLSPDGTRLVYTRHDSDWSLNRRVGQFWLLQLTDRSTRQFTFDKQQKKQLQWSPDGRLVSCLVRARLPGSSTAASPGGRYWNIFLLPTMGGQASRLTSHAANILDYQWAPDGQSIFFLADTPETDEIRKRKQSHNDMFAFEREHSRRQLWHLQIENQQVTRLDTGPGQVLAFSLSPDGSLVGLSKSQSTRADDEWQAELWLMGSDGNGLQQLTENNYAETGFAFAPDNQSLLFLASVNEAGEPYFESNLFVLSLQDGEQRLLAEQQDFAVEDAAWSGDGKSIFLLANSGVRSGLWQASLDTGKFTELADGKHALQDWAYYPRLDRHVFIQVKSDSPGEVASLVQSLESRELTVESLTQQFADLPERYRLPKQDLVQYAASDGRSLQGLLSWPLDYQPGQRYPLVIDVHGGPRRSEKYGQWDWIDYVPVLAAQGYFVFAPNYRGSSGYGDHFLRAVLGGNFSKAGADILEGIDHLVAEGLVEPERLAVRGWSAGGYLVNLLLTETGRFKAASSGASVVEWQSMFGESDIRTERLPFFGGTPWQRDAPRVAFQEASLLQELWKVKTPVILFAGEKDERVPPGQSIILHRALRDLGVESELYLAPREGHSFKELRHRLFKINAELAWFERYVYGRDYVWQAVPE